MVVAQSTHLVRPRSRGVGPEEMLNACIDPIAASIRPDQFAADRAVPDDRRPQLDFAPSLAVSLAFSAVGESAGVGCLSPPMMRRFRRSRKGDAAGDWRIRLSGSGKIRGSSQGPCTMNGN